MRFFLIILSIFFLVGTCLFFWAFEIKENRLSVRSENRPILKEIAQRISKVVYGTATRYNPEGDVLPDQIDDNLKEKIKENLNN